MRLVLSFVAFLMLSLCANGQAIVKGSGIVYTDGPPAHTIDTLYHSEVALDTRSGLYWLYNRDSSRWDLAGSSVGSKTGCGIPTIPPNDKQPYIIFDQCDSLFRYRDGAWRRVSGGGGGGADGVVTGGSYDGTNISLTRSVGGSVNVAIREVVSVASNATGSPLAGEKVWINSTTGNMWYASGASWVALPMAIETVENFASITGSVISPSGTMPITNTSQRIKLYRTGVELTEGADYSISSNTLILVVAGVGERFTLRYK